MKDLLPSLVVVIGLLAASVMAASTKGVTGTVRGLVFTANAAGGGSVVLARRYRDHYIDGHLSDSPKLRKHHRSKLRHRARNPGQCLEQDQDDDDPIDHARAQWLNRNQQLRIVPGPGAELLDHRHF